MTIVEKKMVNDRLVPNAELIRDSGQPQHLDREISEFEIATLLAEELLDCMRQRHDPLRSLCPDVLLDREFNGYRVILMRCSCLTEPPNTLSPREQEIARMVAKGYPNKTIAAVLEISTWTVGTHLRRMFAKLGVNSRAAMIAQLTSRKG